MISIIPSGIISQLKKIKNCQAILLAGSRVIDRENKNSDWDFYIILKDKSLRWRKTWKYKNTWIEIFCNDRKQIKDEFREDLKEGRGVTTSMFATGHILLDTPDYTIQKLVATAKKNWKKGPQELSMEEKNWLNYDLSGYIQDIEDCLLNNNPAPTIFNQAYNEMIRYYYRLSNIWLPRPKDRLNDLKTNHRDIFAIATLIDKQSVWKKKALLLLRLGNYIGRKFDLSLNGELLVKPKKV